MKSDIWTQIFEELNHNIVCGLALIVSDNNLGDDIPFKDTSFKEFMNIGPSDLYQVLCFNLLGEIVYDDD